MQHPCCWAFPCSVPCQPKRQLRDKQGTPQPNMQHSAACWAPKPTIRSVNWFATAEAFHLFISLSVSLFDWFCRCNCTHRLHMVVLLQLLTAPSRFVVDPLLYYSHRILHLRGLTQVPHCTSTHP